VACGNVVELTDLINIFSMVFKRALILE